MSFDKRQPATDGLAATDAFALPQHLIHPKLRQIVETTGAYLNSLAPRAAATLDAARAMENPLIPPPVADIPFESRRIPVGYGRPDIGIYIINAKAGANRPAILYVHGGGFIMGKAVDSIRMLQEICLQIDCAVVSVDYRLAPETTYAGSIEDNYAGLKWLHAHASDIGADPERIAVMGESAGGGHAALLAIAARDRGEVPLCFQCLIYPMLDDRTGTSREMPPHVGTLLWTPEMNRFGWESFLGTQAGGATSPEGSVPARVADLRGLPPAFIGVGALDLFCDEDIDYARRLNEVAVPVELIVVPGVFHAFDLLAAQTSVAKWFSAAKLNALRRGFALASV